MNITAKIKRRAKCYDKWISDHQSERIPREKTGGGRLVSSKWKVPLEEYEKSMEKSLTGEAAVPQWYLTIRGKEIIGGLGVIENDFHDRKDLAPNVCAVYVEEPYRRRGIAGNMLAYVCGDMKARGISTLYLITDHDTFYERYGWKFYCMAQGDGEEKMSRMYIHQEELRDAYRRRKGR